MNGLIGYGLMVALIYWYQIAVAILSLPCKYKTFEKMDDEFMNNSHLASTKTKKLSYEISQSFNFN